MSKDRLNEEQLNKLRNDLHLQLNSGASIFSITEEESSFGPDDWAWSFLRLSSSYQQSYNAHADAPDADLTQTLLMEQPSGIKFDVDFICAEDFGLAAWLPPSLEELPKLKHESDSWFFPLKRPVSEDYRRLEVEELPHRRRPWSGLPSTIKEHAHIAANESPFGYREPSSVPIPIFSQSQHGKPQIKASGRFDIATFSQLWVAIDCSVSPAGQVAAFQDLATKVRQALKDQGWKGRRSADKVVIQEVETADAFAHMRFRYASKPYRKSDKEYAYLWRAVMIDSRAPIKGQIKQILTRLTTVHKKLIADELAEAPQVLRFKNTLSFVERVGDGTPRISSGGSYLKALRTLATLYSLGYTDTTKVAQIIGLHSPSGRYVGSWAHHFFNELEAHIAYAVKMSDEGYRMLIHKQKPNT